MGKWWNVCAGYVSPILTAFMIIWWIVQCVQWFPDDWWNPANPDGLGPILLQTLALIAVLLLTNDKLAGAIRHRYFDGEHFPELPEEKEV